MFVDGVQDEDFCIINTSACTVSKLEWVHQGVSCSYDVLFYDRLHGLHHQGGEGHTTKIIQRLWVVSFGDGMTVECFHSLGYPLSNLSGEQWLKSPRINLGESGDNCSRLNRVLVMYSVALAASALGWT